MRLRVNSRRPLALTLWQIVGPAGRRQMEELRRSLVRTEARSRREHGRQIRRDHNGVRLLD